MIYGINFLLLLTELTLKIKYPESKLFAVRASREISLWSGLRLTPFLSVALRDVVSGGLGSAD